jgi:hypothetical protein
MMMMMMTVPIDVAVRVVVEVVIYSQRSSDVPQRDVTFDRQVQAVRQRFSSDFVQVENYTMKELTISQQIRIVSDAAIYVSLCGGGAVTGMFVPKDSSIVLYYSEHGGLDSWSGKPSYQPALLDYDLFNSLPYARVHWLPHSTMDTDRDVKILIALIQHEIDYIEFLNKQTKLTRLN